MADKPEGDAGAQEQPVADDNTSAAADAATAEPQELIEQLNAANEQLAKLKDQALRAQADADNARRRAARDVENAHKYALEKFVSELLPVLDSLEKAVESAEAASDADNMAIVEGVRLSLKLFLDVLRKAGVEQVDPLGEPFDPERHEAMAMVPNADMEPNSVMDVMQRGYLLNGRLVRAAMVVVSKAPE